MLLAACGGDSGDDGGTQATAPPQPAKVTVTASATGDQVTFDVPAQIKPGATELTLVNNTKEQVEFQIVQLDEGHTLADFLPALESDEGAIPPWRHALGGVGEASPGESRSTVVDLKAGATPGSPTPPRSRKGRSRCTSGAARGPWRSRATRPGPCCRPPPPRS
ncbi:MAG TPA: hypothetical protein VLR51_04835, partial [Actinomycetes bacterium]|nr:hypothetical protein [Actinomycetes bacterium]